MSKKRFIFMSLLPNLVFGFLPYCLSFLGPKYLIFALWGVISIGMVQEIIIMFLMHLHKCLKELEPIYIR